MRVGFLSILIFLLAAIVIADDDKMNACFITINSTEEKELFTKKLSQGKNKGKFNFHEIVPSDDKLRFDWFEQACKKNLRCDILVVSGHFGGEFFGASKARLDLRDLETRSCKNDCKGFISSPKEVFLLGCNTLAGKDKDNRSSSEYLDVLISDGYSATEAASIVEQRYGSVGTSFHNTMKRVFKGVPHIYGFHSIGPSGANIEPLLKKYHKDIPNYHDHLLRIELDKGLALMGDFNKWNNKNNHLASALKITNFAQTSGVMLPCASLKGIQEADPTFQILNNICLLRTDELSFQDGVAHIESLLLSDDFALYLPVISDYVKGYEADYIYFDILKKHPQIRDKIIHLLKNSETGFGKLKVAQIAKDMHVISNEKFKQIEKKAVLTYLTPPVSIGSRDAICSYNFEGTISITSKDIDSRILKSSTGLDALQCLKIEDTSILRGIAKTVQSNSSQKVRVSGIYALMDSKTKDRDIISLLNHKMNHAKSDEEKLAAFYSLASLNQGNKEMFKKLDSLLASDKKVMHLGTLTSEHEVGMFALATIKLKDYKHFKDFYTRYSPKFNESEGVISIFSSIVLNMDDQARRDFIADNTFLTAKQKARIMNDLKESFTGISLDGFNEKMPLAFFPYYYEQFKKDEDENLGFHFRYTKIDTQKDADEFINALSFNKLSKMQKKLLLQHFPIEHNISSISKFVVEAYKKDKSFATNISEYINAKKSFTDEEKAILKDLNDTEDFDLKNALKRVFP